MYRDYYRIIRRLAQKSPNAEICGLLLNDEDKSLDVVPCANEHPYPEHAFQISLKDQADGMATNRLLGYYHSHIKDTSAAFSQDDLASANASGLALFVYSLCQDKFNMYQKVNKKAPLLSRRFIVGYQDCAQLVFDWIEQKFGSRVMYFERPWSMLKEGFRDHAKVFNSVGYYLTEKPYRAEDVLVMCITDNNQPNHVGVLVEKDLLLHQMFGRLSDTTPYLGDFKNRTLCGYRRKL